MKLLSRVIFICITVVSCDNTQKYGDFSAKGKSVYCGKQRINEAKATQFNYIGSRWENLESIYYAKDDAHVYTCVVQEPSFFSPAKTHQTIVKLLEDADPATFTLLERGYAKENKNVFYENDNYMVQTRKI